MWQLVMLWPNIVGKFLNMGREELLKTLDKYGDDETWSLARVTLG
jgi:hypothetical protein